MGACSFKNVNPRCEQTFSAETNGIYPGNGRRGFGNSELLTTNPFPIYTLYPNIILNTHSSKQTLRM